MVSIFGVWKRKKERKGADCFVKMKKWKEGVCAGGGVSFFVDYFFMCFFNGKNIDLLVFL